MKVTKEKVLGVRGGWVIRGRIVEYSTKNGKINRPELMLDKVENDEVGFTMEELTNFQRELQRFADEVLYLKP